MDNENKAPWFRPAWLNPNLTIKLILILVFLSLNALGNVFNALSHVKLQNLQGFTVYLLSAFLYILPVYGLYHLKRWARLLQLTLSLSFVILGILQMAGGGLLGGMITIVLHGLIAIYLLSDEGRSLFKKG